MAGINEFKITNTREDNKKILFLLLYHFVTTHLYLKSNIIYDGKMEVKKVKENKETKN